MNANILFYIAYGFVILWSGAWLWAFWRIASDTLVGMINGEFTLRGLGYSAFCASLGVIPLWVICLLWSEFLGVLPS